MEAEDRESALEELADVLESVAAFAEYYAFSHHDNPPILPSIFSRKSREIK